MNHEGATHLSWNDRLTLARMIKEGFKKPEIAKALGKCERSIYYEINRGLCEQLTTDLEKVVIYCPEVAHRKYREFLAEKGPDLKIGHDHALVKKLEELIVEQQFSPGAALAYIKNGTEEYSTEISEKTLYNYIYRGDVFLVLNEKHLYEKGRRHYAEKSKKQAARAPRGTSIEKRPKEIGSREKFGHWEMDSVMGCKGSKQALLVLTERRTRMGIITLVEDHTAESVVKAINRLERKFGKLFYTLFKSITVDNGSEFAGFAQTEAWGSKVSLPILTPHESVPRTSGTMACSGRSSPRASPLSCSPMRTSLQLLTSWIDGLGERSVTVPKGTL